VQVLRFPQGDRCGRGLGGLAGVAVDGVGKRGEVSVGLFFFGEGLGEELCNFGLVEGEGVGVGGAVGGDFPVLDLLGAGDEAGVEDVGVAGGGHAVFAFGEQGFHAGGAATARTVGKQFKDGFETLDVGLSGDAVLLEGLFERGLVRGDLKPAERLLDEHLRKIDLLQLVDQEPAQGCELHGLPPSGMGGRKTGVLSVRCTGRETRVDVGSDAVQARGQTG
jgi:hypothetical protein